MLKKLYETAESGYLSIWTMPDKKTYWFSVADMEAAGNKAIELSNAGKDVYFGVGLTDKPKPEGRIAANEVTAIPGLWFDMDIAGPTHAQTNLPADFGAVFTFLHSLPVAPSIIVSSGHGVHAYYLFRETWTLETEAERKQAADLLKGFQAMIRNCATRQGWKLDATHDLSRVLRIPGTMNYKSDPLPVKIIHESSERYNPDDLEQYTMELPATTPIQRTQKFDRRPGDGPAMLAISQCAFLNRFTDPTTRIPEPEWFAAVANIARCANGPAVIHDLVRPMLQDKYDHKKTDEKIRHSLEDNNPHSCEYIRNSLGFTGCPVTGCPDVKAPCAWALAVKPKNRAIVRTVEMTPEAIFQPQIIAALANIDEYELNRFKSKARAEKISIRELNAAIKNHRTPELLTDFNFTDLGNAERLFNRHGSKIKFCFLFDCWFIWDGSKWAKDNMGKILELAKETVRGIYDEGSREPDKNRQKLFLEHARKSESRNRILAMIDLTKSMVPVLPDEFDRNPWLLNVQNGVVDLKTGDLLPHNPDYMMAKICSCDYHPDAKSELWESVLPKIFDSRPAVLDFMQRFLGYTITGITNQELMAICYGGGGNGKGTIMETIMTVLGDYAETVPAEILLHSRFQSSGQEASPEIAKLQNIRFVWASETEDGRMLNESRVKSLTGGDTITARNLHSNPFNFKPQFKLWLQTNHLPKVKGQDDGIWRRLRLIPFLEKFKYNPTDGDIKTRLRDPENLPGVLAWAVRGCLLWQKDGLTEPEDVMMATQAFKEQSDVLGHFITECCVTKPGLRVSARILYRNFKEWCAETGHESYAETRFSTKIAERNFFKRRTEKGIFWEGLGLLTSHEVKTNTYIV